MHEETLPVTHIKCHQPQKESQPSSKIIKQKQKDHQHETQKEDQSSGGSGNYRSEKIFSFYPAPCKRSYWCLHDWNQSSSAFELKPTQIISQLGLKRS